MATHSSTLALKIPWTEELGAGYYPWGRKESGTTELLHFLSFWFLGASKRLRESRLPSCEIEWNVPEQPLKGLCLTGLFS